MDPLFAAEIAKEALERMLRGSARLSKAIAQLPPWPAVVSIHEHGRDPAVAREAAARTAAATAIQQLHFHDDQDPVRVVRFVGAVAVDAWTLDHARELNLAKTDFSKAIQQYRRASTHRIGDSRKVRELLVRFGEARLNLVQAYRHVPVLDVAPTSIGFTWILKATQVSPIDDPDSASYATPSPDAPGYIAVSRVAPHMRANVVWLRDGPRRAACIHAPLPILYRYDPHHVVRLRGYDRAEPDPDDVKPRRRRSDAGVQRRK